LGTTVCFLPTNSTPIAFGNNFFKSFPDFRGQDFIRATLYSRRNRSIEEEEVF